MRVRRRREERCTLEFSLTRRVHQTVGIMVWSAITYRSRSLLVFVRGNMNGQRYVDKLVTAHILPFLRQLENPFFHQDNAHPYIARLWTVLMLMSCLLPWHFYFRILCPLNMFWRSEEDWRGRYIFRRRWKLFSTINFGRHKSLLVTFCDLNVLLLSTYSSWFWHVLKLCTRSPDFETCGEI